MWINRREFLRRAGAGFGLLGLADLLAADGFASQKLASGLHFPAKVKTVIWLFMFGGPSAMDLFDPKPELEKHHGQEMTGKGKVEVFFGSPGPLLKSPYSFKRHGKCGAWVSELMPNLAKCVDDITFIKSVHCESNNHAPALIQMNTGMTRIGFPSAGSWVTYGLGSPNKNLPGFVVMYDRRGGPIGGAQNWGAGFLPGNFQGLPFRTTGVPILNLQLPNGMSLGRQRGQKEFLAELNQEHARLHPMDAELAGRIETYELAARMQLEVPKAIDLAKETEGTRQLYGIGQEKTKHFGSQLLMARKLAEQGVRFIQVYSGGGHGETDNWDAHNNLKDNHDHMAAETDLPIAGLLTDLKQRGLWDSTLVVWGGEFGRMPVSQGGIGRDHNPDGFLMWMAGGGLKPGTNFGETDELGYKAVVNPVSVHDIHATILHLLGVDHERLTFEHNGRAFRLTDVSGNVIRPILA
jgi:hypothetical protein